MSEWQFSDRKHFFFLGLVVANACMMLRLCKIVESFYLQARNTFPHISFRYLPCQSTKKILFLHQVSLKLWPVVFPWLLQKSWIRTCLCSSPQYPGWLDTLFECIPNIHGQEMMLVLKSTSSMKIFQVGSVFSVLPACLLARLTNEHSQSKTFSQPCSNRTFSNCLSHTSPAKGRTVDVSKYLYILTKKFWITLMHFPFWAEFTRILHQLRVLNILVALTWRILLLPSLEMLMILAQQTLHTILNHLLQCHLGGRLDHFFLKIVVPTPKFWDDRDPSMTEKWKAWPFVHVSSITSLLFWTFVSCLAGIFLSHFSFFLHCCHCMWYLRCLRHWNKFAHKTVLTQWIHAFSCGVVFMVLALKPNHAYPHRFVGLNNTSIFVVCFPTVPEAALCWWSWNLKQCCWHRNFQLSSSIFHQMLEFFIKEKPRNLLALSSFGFSTAPFSSSVSHRTMNIRQMVSHSM